MSQQKQIISLPFAHGMNQKLDDATATVGAIRLLENMRYSKHGRVDSVKPFVPKLPSEVTNAVSVSNDDNNFAYIFEDKQGSKCTIINPDGTRVKLPSKDIFWRPESVEVQREISGIYQSHVAESDSFIVVAWIVEDLDADVFSDETLFKMNIYVKDKRSQEDKFITGSVLDIRHCACIASNDMWVIIGFDGSRLTKFSSTRVDEFGPDGENVNKTNLLDKTGGVMEVYPENIRFPIDDLTGTEKEDKLFDMFVDDNDFYFAQTVIGETTLGVALTIFRNVLRSDRAQEFFYQDLPEPFNVYKKYNEGETPDGKAKNIHSVNLFKSEDSGGATTVKVGIVCSEEDFFNLGRFAILPRIIKPSDVTINDELSNKVIKHVEAPDDPVPIGLASSIEGLGIFGNRFLSITSFPPVEGDDVNFLFCGDDSIRIRWTPDEEEEEDEEQELQYVNDAFVYMHEVDEDTSETLVADGSYRAETIIGHFFTDNFGPSSYPVYNDASFLVSDNNLTFVGVDGSTSIILGRPGEGSQFVLRSIYSDILNNLKREFVEFVNRNTIAVCQEVTFNGDNKGLHIFAANVTIDRTSAEQEEAEAPSINLPEVSRRIPIFNTEDFFERVVDITYCSRDNSFYLCTTNLKTGVELTDDFNYDTITNSIIRIRKEDGAWRLSNVKTFTSGVVRSIVYSSRVDNDNLVLEVSHAARKEIIAVDLNEYEVVSRGTLNEDDGEIPALTIDPSDKIVGVTNNPVQYSIIKTRTVENPSQTLARDVTQPEGQEPTNDPDTVKLDPSIRLERTGGALINGIGLAPIYKGLGADDSFLDYLNCSTISFNPNDNNDPRDASRKECYSLLCNGGVTQNINYDLSRGRGDDIIFIGYHRLVKTEEKAELFYSFGSSNSDLVSSRDIMGGGDNSRQAYRRILSNPVGVGQSRFRGNVFDYRSHDGLIPRDFRTKDSFYEASIVSSSSSLRFIDLTQTESSTFGDFAILSYAVTGRNSTSAVNRVHRDTFFTDVALHRKAPNDPTATPESTNSTIAFFLSPLNLKVYYVKVDSRVNQGLKATVDNLDYQPTSINIDEDFGNLIEGSRLLPACITVDEENDILYVYGFRYTETLPNPIPTPTRANGIPAVSRVTEGLPTALLGDKDLPNWFQNTYRFGFSAGNIPVFPRARNSRGILLAYSIAEGQGFGARIPESDIGNLDPDYVRVEYDSQRNRFWFRKMASGKSDETTRRTLVDLVDPDDASNPLSFNSSHVLPENEELLFDGVTDVGDTDFETASFGLGYLRNDNLDNVSSQILLPIVDSQRERDDDYKERIRSIGGNRPRTHLSVFECNKIYGAYEQEVSETFTYDTANFFDIDSERVDRTLFNTIQPYFLFYQYLSSSNSFRGIIRKDDVRPIEYLITPQLDFNIDFKRVEYGKAFLFRNNSINRSQIAYNVSSYTYEDNEEVKNNSFHTTSASRFGVSGGILAFDGNDAILVDQIKYRGQGDNDNEETYWLAAAGKRISTYFLLNDEFKVISKFNYAYNTPDSKIVPNTKMSTYTKDNNQRKESLRIATPRVISAGERTDGNVHSYMRYTELNNNPRRESLFLRQDLQDILGNYRLSRRINVAYIDGLHYFTETPLILFDGKNFVDHGFSLQPELSLESTADRFYIRGTHYARHGRLQLSSPFERRDRYRYSYLAIQKWIDFKGNEHSSPVALKGKILDYPIGVDINVLKRNGEQFDTQVETKNKIIASVIGSSFEDKQYYIELYRTEANGQIYHLIATSDSGFLYLEDEKTDKDLLEENKKIFDPAYDLATENFQPSAAVGIKQFTNNAMIWGLPENPNAVWVSRRFNRALRKPVEFVSSFFHEFPQRVVDVLRIDNYAIVVTQNKMFSISADNFLRESPREIECPPTSLPLERAVTVETEGGLIWFSSQFRLTT